LRPAARLLSTTLQAAVGRAPEREWLLVNVCPPFGLSLPHPAPSPPYPPSQLQKRQQDRAVTTVTRQEGRRP
jgi:hypothetical protein